jgi:iron complex outermembrane receptor protein
MNKIISLSLASISVLYASDVTLAPVNIEATTVTEVAQKANKSADVAQALSEAVPSIDMSRRSAIANDVFIRGQKRDNITVEVDGTKIYGACPNRMDPPVSHIVANQIDTIEVIEGPYDVETFGTMSGGLKIRTKTPTKDPKGELNVGFGSFNYQKFGLSGSGGNDTVKVSITASMESSDQYKDGDGNTLAQQVDNYVKTNPKAAGTAYQDKYRDMPAYSKNSVMAKAFVKTLQDQELRLSFTANRSDDILYANSKMDAIYDDSNLYNVEYNMDNLSKLFKNLNFQYYYSDVDHPMGTDYRKSSLDNKVMTNQLQTTMQGAKIKTTMDISSYYLLVGVDASDRNWDGAYSMNGMPLMGGRKSIDNSTTKNAGIFAKLSKNYGAFNISVGARYDDTSITNDSYQSNDYTGFGANLLATYNINKANKLFFGVGQANRVPDARELYFLGSKGNLLGTPDLDQTTNQEFDIAYELDTDNFRIKIKTFYSMLSDYIYAKKGISENMFYNIDATIYGAELSGTYYINDDITLDLGASYKVGEKDQALPGQTDKDLADIAPLRGNIALNYEYMRNSIATLEFVASDKWDTIDSDNGEQIIDSWNILNAKVKHAINKKFDFTLGINNMFDTTYAQSNTYVDLILITGGTTGDIMLMNEPGRYIYTNLDFKF